MERGRSWTIGFVGRIEESTKIVGVEFEDNGVDVERLVKDFEANVRLKSRREDNGIWTSFYSIGFGAGSLPGRFLGGIVSIAKGWNCFMSAVFTLKYLDLETS